MATKWHTGNSYEAKDRVSGDKVRTASRTDLVFGSNSQLRLWLRFMQPVTQKRSLPMTLSKLGTKS